MSNAAAEYSCTAQEISGEKTFAAGDCEDLLITLKQHLASWGMLWRLPELGRQAEVKFSTRLNYALGIGDTRRYRITLNDVLLHERNRTLLICTLCHEAAHIAAFRLHGVFISQHGPEWQALMRAAGFDPQVSRPADEVFGLEERMALSRRRYQYDCPVCGFSGVRGSRNRWLRCGACQRAGREGLLAITRVGAAPSSAPATTKAAAP
jgi:predicted SprT family Zn-dependent metalloprotease